MNKEKGCHGVIEPPAEPQLRPSDLEAMLDDLSLSDDTRAAIERLLEVTLEHEQAHRDTEQVSSSGQKGDSHA